MSICGIRFRYLIEESFKIADFGRMKLTFTFYVAMQRLRSVLGLNRELGG
jgi:hypothetical protein